MKKILFFTLALVFATFAASAQKPAQPVLTVEGGQIQGVPAEPFHAQLATYRTTLKLKR